MSWELWWQITIWIVLIGFFAAFVRAVKPGTKEIE